MFSEICTEVYWILFMEILWTDDFLSHLRLEGKNLVFRNRVSAELDETEMGPPRRARTTSPSPLSPLICAANQRRTPVCWMVIVNNVDSRVYPVTGAGIPSPVWLPHRGLPKARPAMSPWALAPGGQSCGVAVFRLSAGGGG